MKLDFPALLSLSCKLLPARQNQSICHQYFTFSLGGDWAPILTLLSEHSTKSILGFFNFMYTLVGVIHIFQEGKLSLNWKSMIFSELFRKPDSHKTTTPKPRDSYYRQSMVRLFEVGMTGAIHWCGVKWQLWRIDEGWAGNRRQVRNWDCSLMGTPTGIRPGSYSKATIEISSRLCEEEEETHLWNRNWDCSW